MGGIARRAGDLGIKAAAGGILGFAASAPLSIALSQGCAGLTALGLIVGLATGRLRYRRTALDLPLALFAAAEILSIIVSIEPARWGAALRYDWPLILFPVFAQALRDTRQVRRAFGILIASASLVSVYGIWQAFFGRDLLRHGTLMPMGNLFAATGLFGHHLTFAGILLVPAVLSLTLLGERPSWRSGASTLLLLGGVVATFARTVWLGITGGLVGLAIAARGRTRAVSLAVLFTAAAAAVAIPAIRLRVGTLLLLHDDPRMRLWQTALRIWKDHPVFGAGLGSFKSLFEQYKVPGFYMATMHPHNDFLKVLANSGMVGLAAFLWLWASYFRHVGRLFIRAAADPRRPFLLAGMLVVAAFLIAAAGQCYFSDETVVDLFWFFTAAVLVVSGDVERDLGGPAGASGRTLQSAGAGSRSPA
jgi:O-antigen ligase